jgi:hypothetical protein
MPIPDSQDDVLASDSSDSSSNKPQDVGLESIFSVRRPKDLKAGLASGLKSIGKGVACGVAGLVAAPIIGASQEGVSGCAKGVVAGVVGAVVLPVAGLGIGASQGVGYHELSLSPIVTIGNNMKHPRACQTFPQIHKSSRFGMHVCYCAILG